MKPPLQALRTVALKLSDVEEGIACKGTAIECSTFKVSGKAFLFVSAANIRLKLKESLAEATRLAAKEPDRYEAGALGWVKVTFGDDTPLALDTLKKWIAESYRLMAPQPKTNKKSPVKKKPRRKRPA
jgi:hypothetical protein